MKRKEKQTKHTSKPAVLAFLMTFTSRRLTKDPFIATQLNSTSSWVQLSCVAINGPLDYIRLWRRLCASSKAVLARLSLFYG